MGAGVGMEEEMGVGTAGEEISGWGRESSRCYFCRLRFKVDILSFLRARKGDVHASMQLPAAIWIGMDAVFAIRRSFIFLYHASRRITFSSLAARTVVVERKLCCHEILIGIFLSYLC